MVKLIHRQQGHAAILFVMMVPVLFGVFVLGTDGSRAMQDRARLDDALEAASLAISAHNDDNESDSSVISGTGSSVNKQIAQAYISQYMTDMDEITKINIERKECNTTSGDTCTYDATSSDPLFFQYTVDAKTKHISWFGGEGALGDNFNVTSQSTARKYQNNTVDVVFVADFSGSMDDYWNGTVKYLGLLDVIESVLETLDKYNKKSSSSDKNTAAFVPFNIGMQLTYEKTCDYLKYDNYGWFSKYVNYSTTVSDLFSYNGSCSNYDRLFHLVDNKSVEYLYDEIKDFKPSGNTASFQGVIKAAQVLKSRSNNKKLMIILSDGEETGYFGYWGGRESGNTVAKTLYGETYQMCQKIRNTLNSSDTDGDGVSDVESKIAVIGFNYDVDSNEGLNLCAGSDNVYEAENFDDIRQQILQLIVEEIGHLK